MTTHGASDPAAQPLLPIAVKVIVYGRNLYTETGLPLYRYVPLADMVRHQRPIPWASQWSHYSTAWISNYIPLPRTASEVPVVEKRLAFQHRTGAVRDYGQAVYRGWPLYTCGYDGPGFTLEPQGAVPGLFELVSVEEPRADEEPHLPDWPPVGLRP